MSTSLPIGTPSAPVAPDTHGPDSENAWMQNIPDKDFWLIVMAFYQRVQGLKQEKVKLSLKGMEGDQTVSRDAKQLQSSVESTANDMKNPGDKKRLTENALDMLRKHGQQVVDPDTGKPMDVDAFQAKVKGEQVKKVSSDPASIRFDEKTTYHTEADRVKGDRIDERVFINLKSARDDKEFYEQCNSAEKAILDKDIITSGWTFGSIDERKTANPLALKYQMFKYNKIIDQYKEDNDIVKLSIAIKHFKDHNQAYDDVMPLDKAEAFIKQETDKRLNVEESVNKDGPEFNRAQLQAIVSALASLSDTKGSGAQQKNQTIQSDLGEIQALITQLTNIISGKNDAAKAIAAKTAG